MLDELDLTDALVPAVAVVGGVLAALLVAEVVRVVVRAAGRRSALAADAARRCRQPLRITLAVLAVWVALRVSLGGTVDDLEGQPTDPGWMAPVGHGLLIALILAIAWLAAALLFVIEDAVLTRFDVTVRDNARARRARTQITLLRRITVSLVVVVAVASVLLTFPGVSSLGGGILASAGLLSVVAGLAAQTSLANLFAGIQIAFTDAIRVDDVVIVEAEWGRVEEITLTYVVVHLWDDRRLILPSTYFTTTPFQNWTRRASQLLGTVELDLDWTVPAVAMRAELNRLLAATDLWDHRVGVLQVTDATGGLVRVRVLASAADAPTLFDLRCYLREGLVDWLRREHLESLPRTRLETTSAPPRRPSTRGARPEAPAETTSVDDARLFTGSIDALERSKAFSGPGQEVYEEREQNLERQGEGETGEPPAGPVRDDAR